MLATVLETDKMTVPGVGRWYEANPMSARRRIFLALVAGALAVALAAFAQEPQAKVPRVGFLLAETPSGEAGRIEALRAGLRNRGYAEGKTIAIEVRSADGNYDRLPELAAELARLKVDVIVAFGTKALSAARRATTTIAIVDPVMGDPAASGLGSFARPEGNVTGSTLFSLEMSGKRLELLKAAVPRITKVAVLINPANTGSPLQVNSLRSTAGALKLELQALEVRNAGGLGTAFAAVERGGAQAIVVATDTLFRVNAVEIADRAARQRLPSTGSREYAAAGGLIGYGPDPVELYRHAAYSVDRILKGAKPADLPIERPTKLELIINLKTARALKLTIPKSLLSRADEIIR